MALTARVLRFVEEYPVDLNATQAAIRAGYSPKTSMQQGQRLLTRNDVQEAIQQQLGQRAKRTQITADEVLTGLAQMYTLAREISEETRDPQAINAAIRAADVLGKHLGMDKNTLNGKFILEVVRGDASPGADESE